VSRPTLERSASRKIIEHCLCDNLLGYSDYDQVTLRDIMQLAVQPLQLGNASTDGRTEKVNSLSFSVFPCSKIVLWRPRESERPSVHSGYEAGGPRAGLDDVEK
jgi:hypothetical protein